MILALAGGVGGARLAVGLASVVEPSGLTVVVNTGDDFEHLGLSISPDLDSVMYTMSGRHDNVQGWGVAGDSRRCLNALAELGGETWFQLGDLDLATHLQRTSRLRSGATLSEVTAELYAALGVKHRVVPMSDHRVRTYVQTDVGELAFQDYFVRHRCVPKFNGLRLDGIQTACPSPVFAGALKAPDLSGIIFCPSNPWLSISPICALRDVDTTIRHRKVKSVAVSPIIGGASVKGPLGKMMVERGLPATSVEIARHYQGLIDVLIIDERDAALQPEIEDLGIKAHVMPILMSNAERQIAVARAAVDLTRQS
ncbi:2-phospho-L-lactate transferase [Paraburkholderia antibiotica]|uniref:2-phospho-L-lactate transferase n=1 Tax=Paraburkholderia antibiotica TaxID=2728839 RepID=A0A7X9X7M2_9BURK|nr:2-phospho-L-lactate transferase [Paraburkholderia antibiotica]NML32880.1 2-phospho-L-lactate transferase [Paraburkholderia antibiotica]